jgi:hypothetical protein
MELLRRIVAWFVALWGTDKGAFVGLLALILTIAGILYRVVVAMIRWLTPKPARIVCSVQLITKRAGGTQQLYGFRLENLEDETAYQIQIKSIQCQDREATFARVEHLAKNTKEEQLPDILGGSPVFAGRLDLFLDHCVTTTGGQIDLPFRVSYRDARGHGFSTDYVLHYSAAAKVPCLKFVKFRRHFSWLVF